MNSNDNEDDATRVPGTAAGESAPFRILMVDDDPEARLPFVRYLRQRYKWDVVEADTGAEALRVLDPSFHAVVLDEMMPVMRGAEILEKIRSRPDLRSICAIMLTATQDLKTVAGTVAYRPDDYLLKTITDPEKLYRSLALSISRTTRLLPKIRVFLCHSSMDKAIVRELFSRLSRCFVDTWFDEKSLLGGEDWEGEIRKELKRSDIVIVCLSRQSISRPGFLQKEIRYALDRAEEMPEGSIFIIPLVLEKCDVPERFQKWHWIDYTQEDAWERLMRSIFAQAEKLGRLRAD